MWVAGGAFKCKFSIYFQFNHLRVGLWWECVSASECIHVYEDVGASVCASVGQTEVLLKG